MHRTFGRFSALTAVGLVPLALAGFDVVALLAGAAAALDADNAGLCDAGAHFEPQAAQVRSDDAGGADLFVRELGILVEVADTSEVPAEKLKPALALLDATPPLSPPPPKKKKKN